MSVRDFKKASTLFLDAISTFTSYELMDYVAFVQYTVHISMLALDRYSSTLAKDKRATCSDKKIFSAAKLMYFSIVADGGE